MSLPQNTLTPYICEIEHRKFGFLPVDATDASLTLGPNIKAPKYGYAYIYVSNESDEPVYFDNLKVSHERGRIIEEDHYYAFGLKIAAISIKKCLMRMRERLTTSTFIMIRSSLTMGI
jgi:hypothetical protein